MTTIHISNLEVPGFALLSDEESYLNEINNDEFNLTRGGASPAVVLILESIAASLAISVSARQVHDANWGIFSPL
ncbi:hypothetical protein [Nostoc sp. LPT]|uniref:hypothetical protein n=1 Tax=Nostoc sp. LPT TaxID=2815387 RepID=UPI001D300830|nr:hypothetical protein [Nostoc sp. LPT]MBN4005260.1 hypothetical protein [Nostoc sp. LPT]